ncbi:hypothetical protein OFC42_30915, partial [Escherichia coli]|nr:hypothetical protein [Escherichia coli]
MVPTAWASMATCMARLSLAASRALRADAAETPPVQRARTVRAQGRQMRPRSVADVLRETVLWVERVVAAHQLIAPRFGDDR